MSEALLPLVAAELAQPVDPRVAAMAAAIAAVYPSAARAVLFYGSCLWKAGQGLDGQMLDFYLIVSDYRAAYGGGWKAFANRVLPPNVFPFAHGDLSAKYAVLSEADFARMCAGTRARDVSVWARFAQPSRLAWAADAAARDEAIRAVAEATPTFLRLARPMAESNDALAVWRTGFGLTYRSELRAERGDRSDQVVDTDPQRYMTFYKTVTPDLIRGPAALGQGKKAGPRIKSGVTKEEAIRLWSRFHRRGKLLTLLRLAKATTTFAGGIDYLAWKINRHAGTAIAIRPWQRRWPILGAVSLLPRLLAGGAVR